MLKCLAKILGSSICTKFVVEASHSVGKMGSKSDLSLAGQTEWNGSMDGYDWTHYDCRPFLARTISAKLRFSTCK